MGKSSSMFVKCDCGMTEFLANGDHPSNNTTPRTIQGKDLNWRIMYSVFEMGVWKEGIAKLCEIPNMPFSMSLSTCGYESDLHSYEHYLSSSEKKAWKKFRPVWDLNPWPLWYWSSALPTKLTSQLGAGHSPPVSDSAQVEARRRDSERVK